MDDIYTVQEYAVRAGRGLDWHPLQETRDRDRAEELARAHVADTGHETRVVRNGRLVLETLTPGEDGIPGFVVQFRGRLGWEDLAERVVWGTRAEAEAAIEATREDDREPIEYRVAEA